MRNTAYCTQGVCYSQGVCYIFWSHLWCSCTRTQIGLIESHDQSGPPMFLYYAMHLLHSPLCTPQVRSEGVHDMMPTLNVVCPTWTPDFAQSPSHRPRATSTGSRSFPTMKTAGHPGVATTLPNRALHKQIHHAIKRNFLPPIMTLTP